MSSYCYWPQSATGCADVVVVLLSLSIIIYSVVRDGDICMPSDDVIDICDSKLLVTFSERENTRTSPVEVVGQEDRNIENYCQIFVCERHKGRTRKLT